MSSAEGALSARRIDQGKLDTDSLPPLLVSADSHVDEPMDLWKGVK